MVTKILFYFNELRSLARQQPFLKGNRKNFWFTLFTVVLTTGVLGYLLFSQWESLVAYQWEIKPEFIALAFVIFSVILFLNVITWASIMRKFGSKVSTATHFRATTISALGKRLPGTLWYVLWRAQIYNEDTSPKVIVLASSIEMAVTVIAAVIICGFFSTQMLFQNQYNWIGFLIVLGVSLLFLQPKVLNFIMKKMKIEKNDLSTKRLIQWVGIYVLIWLLVGSLLFSIGRIFADIQIGHLGYFIGSTALTGVLSRLLLFSPTIFGFGEISLSLLLSAILPSSIAVIIAISNRLLIIIFEITWALISLFVYQARTNQHK